MVVGDCWIIIIVGVVSKLAMLMTLAKCNAATLPKSKIPLGQHKLPSIVGYSI